MTSKTTDTPPSAHDESIYPLWFPELMPGGQGAGFLNKKTAHSLMFVSRAAPVLLVTFDNLSNVNDGSPQRVPWAYKFGRDNKVSHLGILAHRPDWYREEGLIADMQKLATDGFFEGYERVVFSGTSMGAFGALAFSSLVPGSHVMAFNPQSTLNIDLVPWEQRFRNGREQDWSLPLSDASDLLKGAARISLFYDPYFAPDKAHADRLSGSNVRTFKCWYSNHKSVVFLRKIDALKAVMEAGLFGNMDAREFYRLYRGRRALPWYAGALEDYFNNKGRDKMAGRVRPVFRRARAARKLEAAE